MKKIFIISVLFVLAVLLTACTPAYVKDSIEAKSPGAQILSAQKGAVPAGTSGGGEVWCVVSQSSGVKTRWLVKQVSAGDSTMIMNFKGASQEDFQKNSCTNWDG